MSKKEIVALVICAIGFIAPLIIGFYSGSLNAVYICSLISTVFLALFFFIILSKP
jgi:hypothetical protein